jgi:creatinine amidohydrolase
MPTRPTTPEVRLERLTAQDLEDGQFDKAILPVAATEYHGPHLPYGTDTIAAETLAEAYARALGKTVVLPALDYGVSHHLPWKWTVSLRPETLEFVIRDIGESLMAHGITKLALLGAHDGNPGAVHNAARMLYRECGMSVALLGSWQGQGRQILAGTRDIDLDHAGQSETSMILYAAPETVRMELATNQPRQEMDYPVYIIGDFSGTVPLGYSGNAAAGTAEEGDAIIQAMVDLVVPFLRKLDEIGWERGGWLSLIENQDPEGM